MKESHYLLFFQVHAVVGVLSDDADPMVTVMKLEKAPQESYADIGGLDQQIQEIKVLYLLFCACSLYWHVWHTHTPKLIRPCIFCCKSKTVSGDLFYMQ